MRDKIDLRLAFIIPLFKAKTRLKFLKWIFKLRIIQRIMYENKSPHVFKSPK